MDCSVTLKEIPDSDGKVGLGITYSENVSIRTEPIVKINSEDIGGPSAGLMFTLEILNQLLDEDITKGYRVAGTGVINEDGTIGRIGGIDKKVIAADKAGMEIFFAPDDEISEEAKKKIRKSPPIMKKLSKRQKNQYRHENRAGKNNR